MSTGVIVNGTLADFGHIRPESAMAWNATIPWAPAAFPEGIRSSWRRPDERAILLNRCSVGSKPFPGLARSDPSVLASQGRIGLLGPFALPRAKSTTCRCGHVCTFMSPHEALHAQFRTDVREHVGIWSACGGAYALGWPTCLSSAIMPRSGRIGATLCQTCTAWCAESGDRGPGGIDGPQKKEFGPHRPGLRHRIG